MSTITIKDGNTLKVTLSSQDNVWLPNPKFGGFKVILQDVDGETSGRNQYAQAFRDRKRGAGDSIRKLEVVFPALTNAEMSATNQAISESFFTLEYPDPYTGARRSATFYVGDRTAPLYTTGLDANHTPLWTNLAVNFIER